MKCFYHRDMDGMCAGAIVKWKYPHCECISINYGERLPKEIIDEGEVVFVVDFTFTAPFDDMIWLNEYARLIWIDHHKTAIDKYLAHEQSVMDAGDVFLPIAGVREVGKAGCLLVWEYIHTGRPLPVFVELLASYDIWDKSDMERWNSEILPFQTWWGSLDFGAKVPGAYIWRFLFEMLLKNELKDEVSRMIAEGASLLRFERLKNEMRVKGSYFNLMWRGLRFVCCNSQVMSSTLFDAVWDEHIYDGMLVFGYKGKHGKWKVSLYTEKEGVDLSEIAKTFPGGGGHKKACGFSCDVLPFELGCR